MNHGVLESIAATLGRLSREYYLIDGSGAALLPEESSGRRFSVLTDKINKGELESMPVFTDGGLTFFPVDVSPALYVAIEGADADIGLMAAAFVSSAMSSEIGVIDRNGLFRRIILGRVTPREMPGLLSRFGIDEGRDRACIVLRDRVGAQALFGALNEAFDPGAAEMILLMDSSTVCVVLSRTSEIAIQDSEEFAQAIEATAQELGSAELLIGIGDTRRSISGLSESYEEACMAIEMGMTYNVPGGIYVYKRMVIERLLSEIPDELCRKCYDMLFDNRDGQMLFSDELRRTTSVFMASNLNISEASRMIFIHRNTLIYRLDKIQSMTGLDLRKFDDAATFRLLMLLGYRLGEYEKIDEIE